MPASPAPRFAAPGTPSRPLHLLAPDSLETWLAGQPESLARWVKGTRFSAGAGETLLLLGDTHDEFDGSQVIETATPDFPTVRLAGLVAPLSLGRAAAARLRAAIDSRSGPRQVL